LISKIECFFSPFISYRKFGDKKKVEFTLEKTKKIPILFPISCSELGKEWSKNGEISPPEKKPLQVVNPSV
jgi:hypothetical protein